VNCYENDVLQRKNGWLISGSVRARVSFQFRISRREIRSALYALQAGRTIDIKEFTNAIYACGLNWLSADHRRKMFAKADTDGSGLISFQVLAAHWRWTVDGAFVGAC